MAEKLVAFRATKGIEWFLFIFSCKIKQVKFLYSGIFVTQLDVLSRQRNYLQDATLEVQADVRENFF